ncbi:Nse1 non-SMC component of SMC5-6 complex-domain-containing protein [Gongronella butleri]|nr:Nse1 non-SMC component of SMC5-6 complex-domain-containing protein [Gongronella butleri]
MAQPWNDSHRLFIQSILSHKIMDEEQGRRIYEKICDMASVQPNEDFNAFLGEISHKLNELDMAIKQSQHQTSGRTLLALVNTKSDEIAQLATTHTADEILFYRRLIELIMTADDEKYSIGSTAAIQQGARVMKVSQKAVQEALDVFVGEHWLADVNGCYTLSPRALMELSGYLHNEYPDMVKECSVCSDLITVGEYCENAECGVRIHGHCAQQRFVTNRVARRCPSCNTDWDRTNKFGTGY